MSKKLKVLKIEPEKPPYIKEISSRIESLQAEVEGLIDIVYLNDGCLAVVNDEFLVNGMKPNRRCEGRIICGPFFIVGNNNECEMTSLTDKQIEYYSKVFEEIQEFTGNEPELIPRMTFISF